MTDRDRRARNEADGGDDIPEAVRRAYAELGAEQPPDLIDQAVLNRAKAAVGPSKTRRPWSFGWLHALTTAAVLVLGVTVLLQLRDEGPGPRPAAPEPAREAARPATQDTRSSPAAARAMKRPEEDAINETLARERSATAGDDAAGARQDAPATDASPRPYDNAPSADAPPAAAPLSVERTPEAWLLDIEALVADGRLEAAREALSAFRDAYPDYPIAEDRFPRELLP